MTRSAGPTPMAEPLVDPERWRGKTVFVTGATGFLGGWLVRRLTDYGANVVVLVRRPRPDSQFALTDLKERCTIIHGAAEDAASINQAFLGRKIDAAFHVAAHADVSTALTHPVENFRSAIDSSLLILEEVRTNQPGCAVVVSSSDKAYGPQPTPYREVQNLAPHHPYEVAKACQDLMAQSYGKVFDLPVAVTRCGNYFGGWDFNWRRLIPGTIKAIIEGEPIVLRSDGRFTRDFLYIEDAVDVQLMLAERLMTDPAIRGEAFNFSYEVDLEILDIVRRIAGLMGADIEPRIDNNAKAEIPVMQLSCDKARAELGWQPAHDFETALKETIGWYRDYLSPRSHTPAVS